MKPNQWAQILNYFRSLYFGRHTRTDGCCFLYRVSALTRNRVCKHDPKTVRRSAIEGLAERDVYSLDHLTGVALSMKGTYYMRGGENR